MSCFFEEGECEELKRSECMRDGGRVFFRQYLLTEINKRTFICYGSTSTNSTTNKAPPISPLYTGIVQPQGNIDDIHKHAPNRTRWCQADNHWEIAVSLKPIGVKAFLKDWCWVKWLCGYALQVTQKSC